MADRVDSVPVGDTPTLSQNAHWNRVAQRLYDPEGNGELVTDIVFAVADAEGVEPTELEARLYHTIDPEGIERAFFGPEPTEAARNGTESVEFRYAGYLVDVRSDGFHVYEPFDPDRP
ncbi:HalOD1 output domain-containing protein [Halorubrum xinjiangense]|uniref:HalOD1 output domain-containing protein n=1 Tax=Halorubrum xinjiangense TaxID=261291 RepID=UPI003C6F77A8